MAAVDRGIVIVPLRQEAAAVVPDENGLLINPADLLDSSEDEDEPPLNQADEAAERVFRRIARKAEAYLRYPDRGVSKLPIKVLPGCTALRTLLLQHNNISDPDGLELLPDLQTLSLASNNIKKFPHQVFALEQLTYLNLSNNSLFFIPASIKELKNLEVLWLNNTGISCFPQEMCELKKLETLGARHNFLRALPHEVSDLVSLRWLTLADNKISWLPMCFRHLTRLRHLNLSRNRFSILPPAVGCMSSLKYAFFQRNEIRFPDYVVLLRLSAHGAIKRLDLTENPVLGRPSLSRQFPFLSLSSGWFDWMDYGSLWEESLGTSSLDNSASSSASSFEDMEPIIIEIEELRKAVTFLI